MTNLSICHLNIYKGNALVINNRILKNIFSPYIATTFWLSKILRITEQQIALCKNHT